MGRRFWLIGKLIARLLLLAAVFVFGTYNPSGRSYCLVHSNIWRRTLPSCRWS